MQGRATITVGSASAVAATSGLGTVLGRNFYIQWSVLLILTDQNLPTTHTSMQNYKPDWVETFATPEDLCFGEYPDESIAERRERLANT